MTTPRRPVVGLVTIGQSPRPDIVPDMAEITGPGVEIREAGALDGLGRAAIDALARFPGASRHPVVVALSPYEEEDPAARDELRELTGAPVLLANLLVARVIAELCGG